MIGGGGEKKTLRLVAQYGDACNLFADDQSGPGAVRAKLDALRAHCDTLGTDYSRIRKTILWTAPVGTDEAGGRAFVEHMRGFADVGIEEVHVMPFSGDPVAYVRGIGDNVMGTLSTV
jgi:alkanesulfonate monooxygenase SsuD/methylene tetrahydromethanopterin reductase-like flavin-dependent oxidoreductase (luciferase family)